MEKIRKVFQLDDSVRKLVYLNCFLELEDVWGVKGIVSENVLLFVCSLCGLSGGIGSICIDL